MQHHARGSVTHHQLGKRMVLGGSWDTLPQEGRHQVLNPGRPLMVSLLSIYCQPTHTPALRNNIYFQDVGVSVFFRLIHACIRVCVCVCMGLCMDPLM